jgi:hypothetical protein
MKILPNEHVFTRLAAENPGFPRKFSLKGHLSNAPAKECAIG